MITRKKAVEIALGCLTEDLRSRLTVTSGWRRDSTYDFGAGRTDRVPAALCGPDDQSDVDEMRNREPPTEEVKPSRPVWKVHVPSDAPGVGAGRYLIIDQETGTVLSDQRFGE